MRPIHRRRAEKSRGDPLLRLRLKFEACRKNGSGVATRTNRKQPANITGRQHFSYDMPVIQTASRRRVKGQAAQERIVVLKHGEIMNEETIRQMISSGLGACLENSAR